MQNVIISIFSYSTIKREFMKNYLSRQLKLILITFILISSFSVKAQKFKIDLGAGYGFGLTSTYFNTEQVVNTLNPNLNSFDQQSKRFDYNQGVTGHLKLNYMLNQELFLVAGARYQNGSRSYDPNVYIDNTVIDINQESNYTFKYDQLDVQIGLGIEKKLSDRWSVYLSHGFTFFVYGKAQTELSITSSGSASLYASRNQITVDRPRFTFGAYGDLGLVCKVANNFDLFFNTTVQSKNWSTKSSEITKHVIDGVDQLPGSSISALETVYTSELNTNTSDPGDPNQPSNAQQTWMPNSGLETVLGVRIGFGSDSLKNNSVAKNAGMYIQGTIGYGMPMSELTKSSTESYLETVAPTYTATTTSSLYSYGKGISGQLLLGYTIGNGFSAEIGGVFNRSNYSTSVRSAAGNFSLITSETNTDVTYSAWMVRNTYGVKLESQYKRVNAFVRTGLSLGFAGLKETSDSEFIDHYTPSPPVVTKREYAYSGNVSIGAYIGLGSSVRLSERLDFVAEAVTYIQNWSPKKRELVSHTVDGIDQLEGTSVFDREIEFVSEMDESSNGSDHSIPQKVLRITEPFSSFMITVGLRYTIFRKK